MKTIEKRSIKRNIKRNIKKYRSRNAIGNTDKNKEIDMLQGSLADKLLLFALPIAFASMLQQLFNVADTAVVGWFDSAEALAAVGTNGEIVALVVSLSAGLSIGANVLIASQIGKRELDKIPRLMHTAILFSLLFGVAVLMLGQCMTPWLLRLIRTPEDIFTFAQTYLKIYFLGYPFLLFYDFGSAILRARGDSRYPFAALTVAGIANVLLNLLFVAVFHLGVAGVAAATDLSAFLSAGMILWRLKTDRTEFHLTFRDMRIHCGFLLQLLRIGIPSAIQGAVFCFANIFVQAAVNSFGADVIAGSTIAMNFEYFVYYVITAFGQTATTFASQNYAAGQKKRCRRVLRLCTIFSVLCSLLLIMPIVAFPDFFSYLFSGKQSVTDSAVVRIMAILSFEAICSFYEVPAGILRGMGHSLLPAAATVIGTCVFRILWIGIVFQECHSLTVLYRAFPISWILTIMLTVGCFAMTKPFADG